jgi:hypothetical protein
MLTGCRNEDTVAEIDSDAKMLELHTNFKSRQVLWCAFTRCNMSYDSGSHLLTRIGSDAVICSMAPNLASRFRWAPALLRAPWLQTSPPDWVELRCCHVSYGSRPHLPAEVDSSAATCTMALDLISQLRWASALSCVLWLQTSLPSWGKIWFLSRVLRFLVGHGSQV